MTDIKNKLKKLCLTWMVENLDHELAEAARLNRAPEEVLQRLLEGETEARGARAVQRRLKAARLPGVKTLDGFDWSWPEEINRDHIRHLFTLAFMRDAANVIFIGGVGIGKTHLAAALAREVCLHNMPVLFTSAVHIINDLADAQRQGMLKRAMKKYVKPAMLVIDELGYLPVDRIGAELIFQVLSERYEKASTVITTNRVYKHWAKTFDNDATLASAVLDRVMHHSETVVIKGESYRQKDIIDR